MGRLIGIVLVFYIGLYAVRLLLRLFGGSQHRTRVQHSEASGQPKVAWNKDDIEDADFEEIE